MGVVLVQDYEALLTDMANAIAAAESRGAAQQKQRDVDALRKKAAEKRTMLSQVEAMKPDSFAVATINVIADDLEQIADALEAEAGKA
jgi:hypothetical protein